MNKSLFRITPRERQIIDLLCAGKADLEIAETLGIAYKTVKAINYTLFRKLNVKSRAKLIYLMHQQRRFK